MKYTREKEEKEVMHRERQEKDKLEAWEPLNYKLWNPLSISTYVFVHMCGWNVYFYMHFQQVLKRL